VTETLAGELAKLGAMAQVSVDSRYPDVHDEFRNRPGAWLKTMDGIRYLRDAGVPVTMAATVTTLSIGSIPDLYRLAAQTGVSTFRILPFVPGGRGATWDTLEVSPAAMRNLTVKLNELRAEVGLQIAPMEFECTLKPPAGILAAGNLPIGCDGARAYCTITSSGDVLPCNYFAGVKAENVKDKPFAEIWKTSNFLNYFRSLVVDDLDGPCRTCSHLGNCRGSCLAANFVHRRMFKSNCHCWLAYEASKLPVTT
jgi:radical SAM protein with 4Fe4S-binding SPASM domain